MNGNIGSLTKRVAALEQRQEQASGMVRVLTLSGMYGEEPAAEYVRADRYRPLSLAEFYDLHGVDAT